MKEKKKTNATIELQDRDYDALGGLFESRVMLRSHFVELYFAERVEYAKKRIQRLVQAGLVRERALQKIGGQFPPTVLSLGTPGLYALEKKFSLTSTHHLPWNELVDRLDVANSTLEHELGVMETKASFVKALRSRPQFQLQTFSTWPRLNEFRTEHLESGKTHILKPDAYIEVHESSGEDIAEHRFFLEHDRGPEVRRTLAIKAHGYAYYYRKGGLARRHGMAAEDYKEFPFRVLFSLQSEARRNGLAERLLQETHLLKQQFLLTTMEELIGDPVGEIWMNLKDYQQITAGTMYDPAIYKTTGLVSARDRLVAEKLTKRSLFDLEQTTQGGR